MVRAMAAIATNTKSIEPYAVRAIRAEAAAPLYTRPETAPDRPEWNRAAMMPLLEAVVTEGTGKAARLTESPGRRSAGKTGTTDDYRDAWFVGFTSDIVVGIWVGNDNNSPMDRVTGGDIPAKIWHDFVTEAERIMATPNAPAQAPAAGAPAAGAPGTAAPAPSAALAPSPSPGQLVPPPPAAAPPPNAVQPATLTGPPPQQMRGIPVVVDSATLLLNGALVRLDGIAGEQDVRAKSGDSQQRGVQPGRGEHGEPAGVAGQQPGQPPIRVSAGRRSPGAE